MKLVYNLKVRITGPDKISNKMIISIKNEIAKPLCLLFSKFLRLKKYPRSWKIAHVIPLFKNGDKSLPSNYRPVHQNLVKICFRRLKLLY
jgi:hypothetical protein